MIAIDTNLLVYAHRRNAPEQERAEPSGGLGAAARRGGRILADRD
jgi:hypothetical protein